jgi:hypothetical protein
MKRPRSLHFWEKELAKLANMETKCDWCKFWDICKILKKISIGKWPFIDL